ncbi:hypothetical protein GCM10011501_06560 [Thalassotalea profundi]|uniref:CHASE domain-containing protein n=1 Tax=Thalassotalea profundi TaxID=2036687 RepID=A0ABQ3IE53_9GAMM|nr:hypothetical protein GCM10011501_06560 [Thalassotalea profundi]
MVAYTIKPFSLINFVGPVAGISTAILLVWGNFALLSVLASSLLILLLFNWYGELDFNLAIVILIYLAALLQSFWAKQLTYKLINKQKWVASRSTLISFMMKIGPLVGLVAAVCGIIVAILDNNTFNTSLGYAFFRGWSTSVLVSVFAIPSLLFIVGKQNLNVSKRVFVIVSSVLGCIAIGLLFLISQQQQQHIRNDLYKKSLYELNHALVKEISDITAKIKAMTAYFNSSVEVNLIEFTNYANEIYQADSSVKFFQWSPVVSIKEKLAFEQYAKIQLGIEYSVIASDVELHVEQNDFTPFTPVLYIYPEQYNDSYYGIDLYANNAITNTITLSLNQQEPIASAPFSLNQKNELAPHVMLTHPVNNRRALNTFGEMKSSSGEIAVGFLSAAVDLETFVNKLINSTSSKNISMNIIDVTSGERYLIYGDKLDVQNRLEDVEVINFFGRKWQLQIIEKSTWLSQNKSWQTWVMLFGGVIGGFVFQLLILMMAAYSIELSYKVAEKTRELIKANELSEKENLSKAHFLQMLTIELSVPIKLAERLIHNQHVDIGYKKLQQFSDVTEQLKHILTSVSDLSTLESRNNKLDNQVFDFSYFLNQIENKYQEKALVASNKIKFLFDCELPNFVEADQTRLEKLLLVLQENILKLFLGSDVQMSIKAHYHKDFATLFFTCSALTPNTNMPVTSWLKKDIANFSTSMALATELVHILKGNIKLILVPTGDIVMTISLPIGTHFQESGLNKIDEMNVIPLNHKAKVLLIEEPLSTNFETTPLLLGLDYQVEIIDDVSELSYAIHNLNSSIIIIDNVTSKPYVSEIEASLNKMNEEDAPKVIGIYRGIEYRQLSSSFKNIMSDCLLYPISAESLQSVLAKVTPK